MGACDCDNYNDLMGRLYGEQDMAEFVGDDIKYVGVGESVEIDEENMGDLHDWCVYHDIIYVQWYPCDNCSGYYIENPSEDALEKFYENVNASDPYHESFVLRLGRPETHNNLNMRIIDEYIQHNILPLLFDWRKK